MTEPTVLIVPGLRDHVDAHWQTRLARELPRVRVVPPMGRENLDCTARIAAMEREAQVIDGPLIVVAHSGGVVMVVHWARFTRRPVAGALLATPPDFSTCMPPGYPTPDALRAGGWLPVPREPLPFRSIVVASHDDPLASFASVREMAACWGSRLVDLGTVGHLNPASGFGPWPLAHQFIAELASAARLNPPTLQRDQGEIHGTHHPL